jgi:hypothetical protein
MRIRSWLAGTCLVPLVAAAAFAPSGRGGSEPPVSDIANGFVTDWVLLGPFATNQIEEALPAGTPRARFHRDFLTALGGESRAVLKAGQAVGYVNRAGGRREARAQRINPALDNPDCLDFRHILNDRHFLERDYDQAVAYAFCYLRSAQDQKVFAYLSSDGSPKVWVNGELVFQKWERGRKSRPPWQDGFALRLRKGVNPVLIKIDNDMNWWGFQFEVYDGAHHAGAIRNTVKSLAFRDVRAAEGRISALVDLVPAPLGIAEAPVRVEVESIDKRPIAARGGMTGRRIEVALPPGFSGPVNVRAVAAGGPFPALKPAAQFCYAGNFVSTLAELKRRFEAARGHASGYPSPWAPVYRGALDWIDRFFDSDFSTVTPGPSRPPFT